LAKRWNEEVYQPGIRPDLKGVGCRLSWEGGC
jgi:hypothetical protein